MDHLLADERRKNKTKEKGLLLKEGTKRLDGEKEMEKPSEREID